MKLYADNYDPLLAQMLKQQPIRQRRRLTIRVVWLVRLLAVAIVLLLLISGVPPIAAVMCVLAGVIVVVGDGRASYRTQQSALKRGLYVITCLRTHATYVGSTTRNFYQRWGQHINDLTLGKHINQRLQHDWTTYGAEAFTFHVLEEISDPGAIEKRERTILAHRAHHLPLSRNYNVAHTRTYPVAPTPELQIGQPDPVRSDTSAVPNTIDWALVARLVQAGAVGETAALKALGYTPGSTNARYQAARAALHQALGKREE